MKKFLLIALLCVSGNAGAIKVFTTGNDLLSYCSLSDPKFNRLYCYGYVAVGL